MKIHNYFIKDLIKLETFLFPLKTHSLKNGYKLWEFTSQFTENYQTIIFFTESRYLNLC